MPKREKCGLKTCNNDLGPGAAAVGYEIEGKRYEVRVCSKHAWDIMVAPRGTWRITPDLRLEALPAKPTIIT